MANQRLNAVLEPVALAYVREKTHHKRKGSGKYLSALVLAAKAREEAEAAAAQRNGRFHEVLEVID